MTYIVESGSKQYTVEAGQKFIVDRLKTVAEGDTIALNLVYAYGADSGATSVQAVVLKHQRGVKIRVTKYLPKSNYHRQYGPRAEETVLEVVGGVAKKTTTKSAEVAVEKVEAKPAKKTTAAKKVAVKKPAAKKTPVIKKTPVEKKPAKSKAKKAE